LLIAGIGLAIGAFIAAALPSTEAEDSVFGQASDAVRRQAEAVGAKGIEAAKAMVDSTQPTARVRKASRSMAYRSWVKPSPKKYARSPNVVSRPR